MVGPVLEPIGNSPFAYVFRPSYVFDRVDGNVQTVFGAEIF